MFRFNRLIVLIGLAGLLLLSIPGLAASSSSSRTDRWFFGNEMWSPEIQLNVRSLGHLGNSAGILPDSLDLNAQYGVWWEHFLEAHVQGLKSVSGDVAYSGIGAGARVNVLEFSKANALEFAGETTALLKCVETRRGLLSPLLRSFLVHLDLDYNQYFFSSGATSGAGAFSWGGGVQWGPNFRISGISRFYIDMAVQLSRINGTQYLVPYAGLGINY